MDKLIKKIIPIIYFISLYVFPITIFLEYSNYNLNIYLIIELIIGILNIIYSFRLYKLNSEGDLKFASFLLVIGLIPYYLIMLTLFVVMVLVVLIHSSSWILLTILIFLTLYFVLFSCAFYQLNLVRLFEAPNHYKIMAFVPIFNIISCVMFLINVSRETFERKQNIL